MLALRGEARNALAWPRMVAAWGSLLPPYPGADVVPLARVPAPPLLAEGQPLQVHVLRCAEAYRAAVRHYFGPFVGAFPRQPTLAQLRQHRDIAQLRAAARLLCAQRRPPLAWCAFSAWVWRAYAATRAPRMAPPLRWVFSLRRLREQEEWFAWQQSRYKGGRVLLVPAQRELMRRYARMRAQLLCLAAPSEAEVREVVEGAFPGESYGRLVEEAREQVLRRVDRLQLSIQRGGFIW